MSKKAKIKNKIPPFFRAVFIYALVWLMLFSSIQVLSPENFISVSTINLPARVISKTQKVVNLVVINGQPISMQIERLGIDLPIKPGTFDAATGNWTLSDDAVYYANMTALPNNQRGSTFLYGHNRASVLAPLAGLVLGDILILNTSNGHTFRYVYIGETFIPPDLTSVLYDNPETPRLTVMTCEGIWSQARRLMYFDLTEAK